MHQHDWVPAALDWLAFATFLATAAAAWIAAWSVRRADRALVTGQDRLAWAPRRMRRIVSALAGGVFHDGED
jgi:hypothetical protein